MGAYKRLKKRVYEIIGPTAKGDRASGIFDVVLCALVMLSSAAVIIELFPIPDGWRSALNLFEYITVAIFIFEYAVRLWVCEFEYPECPNKIAAIWEFITSFSSLIDILSIVSVVFNQIPKEFAILRLVKLIKLVRLAKMSDYVKTSGKLENFLSRAQKRTNEIIDKGREGDIPSKIYDITSVVLIFLSVSFILVETFAIGEALHQFIYVSELVIACLFSVEYVLRVWTAPLDYPELRPDKARMHYIFSFMSLVDLLSIIPVFVADMSTATGILKIFKLCKILRLLKASRYLSSIANFGLSIKKKKKQIVMSVVAIAVMIAICSVLMYSFENKEQPEAFTNGFSGIGYCLQVMIDSDTDIAPITAIGQALSTLMLLLGGCMFGVPVAIVATGFEDMIAEQAGQEEDAEIYDVLRAYDELSDENKARFMRILASDRETDNGQEE